MKLRLVEFLLLSLFISSAFAQDTVHIYAGWNIIGSVKAGAIPDVLTTDPPDIITTAFFGYDPGSGYQSTDTLEKGLGYWIKASADGIALFAPTTISQDTVNVQAGWNLVGALIHGPIATSLTTEPAGIITSSFFGYMPGAGYSANNTVTKGLGYWVKVSTDGIIIWDELCGIQQVTYGGVTYNTVKIGDQCWLKENMNVGVMIDSLQASTDNDTIEKYCYNNDTALCATYGGLYTWDETMQYVTTPGTQGVCPPGWHIPTSAEFTTLISTVGGDGNTLKQVGVGTGSGAGTNTSGFSALLAGYRDGGGGSFSSLDLYAIFWSSTEVNPTTVNFLGLDYNQSPVYVDETGKDAGFSVRCLKD